MKNLLFIVIFALSNFAISQNQLHFKAEIANRNGDVIYIKDTLNKTIKEIKVDDKGIFEASFDVKEGLYLFDDTREFTILYLKNGFDMVMKMDASQFDESISYSGKGSKENNYLDRKSLTDEEYQRKIGYVSDENSFNALKEEFKNKFYIQLQLKDLDPKFVTLAKGMIERESKELDLIYADNLEKQKLNNTNAPRFEYVNYNGGKTKLEDFKGMYVYIDVWATWCGPCRAEIPSLKKAEKKYEGKNIAFVSISVDEDKDFEKWKSFIKSKELGGTQLFADHNWNSDFIKSFSINSIPRFILIDPTGNVINADAERPSNPKLIEILDKLLN